jgi:hypothetical protein
MATELLSAGVVYTLVQNQVYALPARAANIDSSLALETANTTAFATNGTVAANTPTKVSAGFVRCTTGAAVVSLKYD